MESGDGLTFSSSVPTSSPYPLATTAIQFWGYYISEFTAVLEGMDMAAIPCNDRLGFGGAWNAVSTISLILYTLGLLGRVVVLAIPVVAALDEEEVRMRRRPSKGEQRTRRCCMSSDDRTC